MTYEVPIQAVLDEAEERGTIEETVLEALALEHELEDEELAALRAELEEREVEILAPVAPARVERKREPEPVAGSTDALTLLCEQVGVAALAVVSGGVTWVTSRRASGT